MGRWGESQLENCRSYNRSLRRRLESSDKGTRAALLSIRSRVVRLVPTNKIICCSLEVEAYTQKCSYTIICGFLDQNQFHRDRIQAISRYSNIRESKSCPIHTCRLISLSMRITGQTAAFSNLDLAPRLVHVALRQWKARIISPRNTRKDDR